MMTSISHPGVVLGYRSPPHDKVLAKPPCVSALLPNAAEGGAGTAKEPDGPRLLLRRKVSRVQLASKEQVGQEQQQQQRQSGSMEAAGFPRASRVSVPWTVCERRPADRWLAAPSKVASRVCVRASGRPERHCRRAPPPFAAAASRGLHTAVLAAAKYG